MMKGSLTREHLWETGDDEIWRSRGNANDKYGIVVENEGDLRDERGSKVHMPTRDTREGWTRCP